MLFSYIFSLFSQGDAIFIHFFIIFKDDAIFIHFSSIFEYDAIFILFFFIFEDNAISIRLLYGFPQLFKSNSIVGLFFQSRVPEFNFPTDKSFGKNTYERLLKTVSFNGVAFFSIKV